MSTMYGNSTVIITLLASIHDIKAVTEVIDAIVINRTLYIPSAAKRGKKIKFSIYT
ncbi:MAG TPA: hypothetical protein VIY08_06520 [Candidatus Nitrosocosmicus sp.]